MEVIVNNLKDTKKVAQKIAKLFSGGEIILLNGDLGAGKTTFTRFVLKSLGVKDEITSPTFTIMKEYKTKKFNIYHFDVYRLSSGQEAIEYGLDEFINSDSKDNLVFIEWSENINDILSDKCIKINISIVDGDKRKIVIER